MMELTKRSLDLRRPVVEICAKECQMSFWTSIGEVSVFSTLVTDDIFQVSKLSGLARAKGYAVAPILGVLQAASHFALCKKMNKGVQYFLLKTVSKGVQK